MKQPAPMNEKQSEHDLLAGCQKGDRMAFGLLFDAHHKRVFSVALNFFGGDSQRAEDITQMVFLKIFRRIENFRGDAEISTWLYRITVNACIDEQKKARRFSFIGDLFKFNEPKIRQPQDEKIYRKEISVEVQKAVGTLDLKYRLPLVLKYVENLSYREIAEVLDLSEGTVASRLNRGHKLLARKLEHLKGEI